MSVTQVKPLVQVIRESAGELEFRDGRGLRHSLTAILSLVGVATLCGCRTVAAIAQWGHECGYRIARQLGFKRRPPSEATFHRVLAGLDLAKVEAMLGAWAQTVASEQNKGQCQGVALDGKALRGSLKHKAEITHLVAALAHGCGVTLAQQAVPPGSNEIPVSETIVDQLPLHGRIVTTDALLTQQTLAQKVIDKGGDYLLTVKGNQPQLHDDIKEWFDTQQMPATAQCHTTDLAHGRLENRTLTATTELNGYLRWPGLQQVFRIERKFERKSKGIISDLSEQTVYGITSLSPERASPSLLLHWTRQHWHIENKLHYVRDVTFDEDHCQVRTGSLPQVLAAFRNMAISCLRSAGYHNIARACRSLAAKPWNALRLFKTALRQ